MSVFSRVQDQRPRLRDVSTARASEKNVVAVSILLAAAAAADAADDDDDDAYHHVLYSGNCSASC